jgi:poly(3-hydroxybutyrate) depolymerase
MSFGGVMSNTVGCEMGDVVRAIAPIAGAGPNTFGGSGCKGPVAAWLAHGTADQTVEFSMGEASRDYWLDANGCDATFQDIDPPPCVAYDGCDAEYPVTWCAFDGGHTVPDFTAQAVWDFFSQF